MRNAAPGTSVRLEPMQGRLTNDGADVSVEPPVTGADAAVCLVLRGTSSDLELLLIERAHNPSDLASGQVALPGGRVAPEDRSLTETVLRELEEEVGLTAADLEGPPAFVGTDYTRRFHLRVAVFAARHASRGRAASARSAAEVASVFWIPRLALDRNELAVVSTDRGPTSVPATVFEGHVLWGFTFRVVRGFFGLEPEGIEGAPAPQTRRERQAPASPIGPGLGEP